MPKVIELPALSSDFEAGVIEEWTKAVGDAVAPGDVIAEVSTDKAVVEIEADTAGTLGSILVEAGGDEVAVKTPIAILLLDGEDASALDGFSADSTAAAEAASTEAAPPPPAAAAASEPEPAEPAPGGRIKSSPSARVLAKKLDVDIATVGGTGPGGRIVRGDIIAASESRPAAPAPSRAPAAPVEVRAGDTRIENDRVRKVIASKLTAAKQDIPHFYLEVDYQVDKLLEIRKWLNGIAGDDYKLTVNDMIVKAVACAMRDVPEVNRSWSEEATIQYGGVDISVAVDSPSGLVTPVLRDADVKRLSDLSNEGRALIQKARDGKLAPDDYKGGGITISNLGMFGIRSFAAIINPPQASILAVGAARKVPVIVDDEPGVATIMSCTLSVDHRVVDGALGARFLQVLGSYLEEPERMLKKQI